MKKYIEEKDLKQLYVGNLPLGFTRDELRALSSDIADVIPRAKRCCFLTFASEEKADANYKALQGKELKGQLLNIDYMGAKSKNQKNIEEMNLKSLYVGNLPICATSAQLKALSSDIKDVHMPPDFKKIRRRYAFIRFASEEKADANYESLQGVKLKGQVLKIDYMGQKRWKNPNLRLHISDIPLSASLEDVSAHFPKADEVKFNEEFRYAFVKFLKQKDYDEALNLKEIEIDGCKLEIQQVDSSSKNMRQKGKNKSTSVLQGDSPAKKSNRSVGSLVVRASDFRPEGLGSMPPNTLRVRTCSLNPWVRKSCGWFQQETRVLENNRGGVAMYRVEPISGSGNFPLGRTSQQQQRVRTEYCCVW
ncbi:multiple RNA-binding domain-containing protein 1 [Trichonephila clavipes]|nr:multiple RNA-binding domain-containing protein 1 [Trichonephila clavipes]